MARSDVVQTNFLSGVLDPRAAARVETDAYNNGLLRGINIEPITLGGIRRRRGMRYRATAPNALTRVSTGVTITVPEGGTAANANDDDESTLVTTTSDVGTTDPYVVVHYDLGSAKTILFADAILLTSSGGSSTEFAIQHSSDDSTWTTLGTALPQVDSSGWTYRRAGPVSARYWRIAKVGGTDMGSVTLTLAGFNLWTDAGSISAGRAVAFEVATDERYIVVLTDRSATIYSGDDGSLIDRQPMPYVQADLAAVDATTDAETMILVHEDYPPRMLIRDTATNFQTFLMPFDAIAQLDYDDSSSPAPTSDVQTLVFDSGWKAGDTFQVVGADADGNVDNTGPITYFGDANTTAAAIANAVQQLWVVQGFSGVTCTASGSTYTLTLAGDSADAYGAFSVTPLSSGGTAAVTHTTTGVSRREDVWSATRGWPRTVEFFGGRLYFGGTKSRQQSLFGSQVNNISNFDPGQGLDDDPIFETLNGRQLNAIQGLFAGRNFQIFTTGGEFRFDNDPGTPIKPGDSPANQTQYGGAKIRPVTIDGATVFIQRNLKSVRDFRYDYTQNAYDSLGVSALSPNLIYNVQDLAAWNGSSIDEINYVLVVNGTNPDTSAEAMPDGSCAILNSRKEAQVQAWTIWTTAGEFKAVCTILQEIFFLVKRTLNGVDVLLLEQCDPDLYTDSAVTLSNATASATATGLDHLDGVECRVRADDYVFSNVTPVSGSATLDQAAKEVEVGLNWTPEATPMPLQTMSPLGTNLMRKKRVVRARAKVRNTVGLLINGSQIPTRQLDIDTFDTAPTPFSGVVDTGVTTNWDEAEDKLVSFTQVDPCPFELLGMDIQIESNL